MTIKRIHHINFIVEDLDDGIRRYEKILGDNVFHKDELPQRGALTARTKIGEQWFILVQPTDFDLPPGKHLRENGEGFFLLSLEVEDLSESVSSMENRGLSFVNQSDRKGLLNWYVRDINKEETLGEQIQLCEEKD